MEHSSIDGKAIGVARRVGIESVGGKVEWRTTVHLCFGHATKDDLFGLDGVVRFHRGELVQGYTRHCNRWDRTSACELFAVEQLVVAEEQLGHGAIGLDSIGDGERP